MKAFIGLLLVFYVLDCSLQCGAAPDEWMDSDFKGDKDRSNFHIPEPPVFPTSYEVKYTFSMPYTLSFQDEPLSYNVHLWYDGETGLLRVDSLDGLDSTFYFKTATFEVVPALDKRICIYWDLSEEEHLLGATKALPTNLTGWSYGGATNYKGRDAHVWVTSVKVFERVEFYYFYVSSDGHPLLLSVMGQDWFTGSHFDQYIAEFDYDSWKPGPIDAAAFALPEECTSDDKKKINGGMGQAGVRMQTLIPRFYRGDEEYDQHALDYGRKHSSPGEYHMRLKVFKSNKLMIEEHNAKPDKSYTLGLNKYADWTEEEFTSAMLGMRGDTAVREKLRAKAPVHVKSKSPDFPESLDWEGTLSDGVVKDQASCGSCWAFGAVASMEAVWFIATGQRLSLSEQQVVDCAWPYGVWACDGGWSESAIEYVSLNGGIMTENGYRYIGQDDWCRFNTTEEKKGAAAFFSGFSVVPKDDLDALKEALFANGPLAVALDASDPHFRFYLGGVYDSKVCDREVLDHVVTLVGYGVEDGVSFFKIRNSWSKFWGTQGYMKIAQSNDCGIMTDAVYAIVDEEKAKEAREGGEN